MNIEIVIRAKVKCCDVLRQSVFDRMTVSQREHPHLETLSCKVLSGEQAYFLGSTCAEMRQNHPEIVEGELKKRSQRLVLDV